MKLNRIILPLLAAMVFLGGCGEKKKKDPRAFLKIKAEPESARILIDGEKAEENPASGKISPGKHTLKITADGYQTFWKLLDVAPSSRMEMGTVNLQPVKAAVMIDSDPKGALLTFKGNAVGTTPCILRDLAPGEYKASLKAAGYSEQTVVWKVENARPKRISATLKSNRGTIEVRTQPQGARVFVNGNPVGKSPYKGDYESGKYRVSVEMTGYVKFTNEAVVTTGQTALLNIALDPKKCGLGVRSVPDGVAIRINGKDYGGSPVALTGISAGEYRISGSMKNYDEVSKVVNLAPGQELEVVLELMKNTGSIEFVTAPSGIRVYLDNRFQFVTEKDPEESRYSRVHRIDNLKPGSYTLSFRHKRAVPSKIDMPVSVDKGKTFRPDGNIEMWIPNARITKQDGSEALVRVVAHLRDGSYMIESSPGFRYKLKKEILQKIEMLGDGE